MTPTLDFISGKTYAKLQELIFPANILTFLQYGQIKMIITVFGLFILHRRLNAYWGEDGGESCMLISTNLHKIKALVVQKP